MSDGNVHGENARISVGRVDTAADCGVDVTQLVTSYVDCAGRWSLLCCHVISAVRATTKQREGVQPRLPDTICRNFKITDKVFTKTSKVARSSVCQ